jgi:hypothetical protein
MPQGVNGQIGEIGATPARFHDDYFFKARALPNAGEITSEMFTLNNTLAQLQIRGVISGPLTLAAAATISAKLQYHDGTTWRDDQTMWSRTGAATIPAGDVFLFVVPPDTIKRDYRVVITASFNAAAVSITCPIEQIPKP